MLSGQNALLPAVRPNLRYAGAKTHSRLDSSYRQKPANNEPGAKCNLLQHSMQTKDKFLTLTVPPTQSRTPNSALID